MLIRFTRNLTQSLLVLALLLPASQSLLIAQAQAAGGIEALSISTQAFPEISLLISVEDQNGRRAEGLERRDFNLIEDGQPMLDFELEAIETGVNHIFAINTIEGLDVRDSRGLTRFDFVREALLDYWRRPEASRIGQDDLTLLTTDQVLVRKSHTAAQLASSLAALEPVYSGSEEGLDILVRSLESDFATGNRNGAESSLIFFTPPISPLDETRLDNVIARAQNAGIAIYPILLAPDSILENPETDGLLKLAQETDGRFLFFDPLTGLEPLAENLLSQRYQYRIRYNSRVQTGGDHSLQIEVLNDTLQATSGSLTFDLDVQPPEIAFIQPPEAITRKSDDPAVGLDRLPPTQQVFNFLIQFPDGHERPLAQVQLWANGEVVAQQDQAPFNSLLWDLSSLHESETHTVQAQVRDQLGLVGQTIELPIQIIVQAPPGGLSALQPALGSLLAALGVVIVGVMIATRLFTQNRRVRRSNASRTLAAPSFPRINHLNRVRLRRPTQTAIEAELVPLENAGPALSLTGSDLTLGRDPALAQIVIDDASISGAHARLIRQADGAYQIRDHGSVAGTWINFELVPADGHVLQDQDVVHLGRMGLLYRLPESPSRLETQVSALNDDSLHDRAGAREPEAV